MKGFGGTPHQIRKLTRALSAGIAIILLATVSATPGLADQTANGSILPFAPKAPAQLNPGGRYVHSLEEFTVHTLAHNKRMKMLAIEMIREFPGDFPGLLDAKGQIRMELLEGYFALHDQPKIMNKNIASRIYENYGRNFRDMSGQDKAYAMAAKDRLNRTEDRLKSIFIKKNHLKFTNGEPTAALKSLKRVERLCDEIDRYLCDVSPEEWAKKMDSFAEFRLRIAKENPLVVMTPDDVRDIEIARHFENKSLYERITGSAHYNKVKAAYYELKRKFTHQDALLALAGKDFAAPAQMPAQLAKVIPLRPTLPVGRPQLGQQQIRQAALVQVGYHGARQPGCATRGLGLWMQNGAQAIPMVQFRAASELRPYIKGLEDIQGHPSFLKAFSRNAHELKIAAHHAAQNGEKSAEKFYTSIANQIPKEGYIRALSPVELSTIVAEGKMGRGFDFTALNTGARVGHGNNFVFLRCKDCPAEMFVKGKYGSSVVNSSQIPLEKLEFIVPENPLLPLSPRATTPAQTKAAQEWLMPFDKAADIAPR